MPSPTLRSPFRGKVDDRFLRWYAVKLFERDDKVQAELNLNKELLDHIDAHITDCERKWTMTPEHHHQPALRLHQRRC